MSEDEKATAQKLGGLARAKKLPVAERKKIARQAAETRWARAKSGGDLLRATHYGELTIGKAKFRCAVLEDGQRLLSTNTFIRAIGRKGNLTAKEAKTDNGSDFLIPEFLAAENLKPFLPNDLEVSSRAIYYLGMGRPTIGYKAELLPVVCQVYQDAKEANALHHSQVSIADVCRLLYRGFATVGIVALVDEATGYQEVRERDALQAILDAYLAKELAAWAKRFPDDFYREMFRLKKWNWHQGNSKRTHAAAHLTKNLVYLRLAPELLKELEERNPVNERGRRKARHHQWLTNDVGHPALAQHLHAVITLMRASTSWDQFSRMLDRSLPMKTRLDDLPLFSGPVLPSAI